MAFPQLHHIVTHQNILTLFIVLHKNVSRSSESSNKHIIGVHSGCFWGENLHKIAKRFSFLQSQVGHSLSLCLSLDGNKEGFSRSSNLEVTILNSPGSGCQGQIQKVLPPFVLECTSPLRGTKFQRSFCVWLSCKFHQDLLQKVT